MCSRCRLHKHLLPAELLPSGARVSGPGRVPDCADGAVCLPGGAAACLPAPDGPPVGAQVLLPWNLFPERETFRTEREGLHSGVPTQLAGHLGPGSCSPPRDEWSGKDSDADTGWGGPGPGLGVVVSALGGPQASTGTCFLHHLPSGRAHTSPGCSPHSGRDLEVWLCISINKPVDWSEEFNAVCGASGPTWTGWQDLSLTAVNFSQQSVLGGGRDGALPTPGAT